MPRDVFGERISFTFFENELFIYYLIIIREASVLRNEMNLNKFNRFIIRAMITLQLKFQVA